MFTLYQVDGVDAEEHFLFTKAVFEKLVDCDFGAVTEHVYENIQDSG
jgi:hypothetical protein